MSLTLTVKPLGAPSLFASSESEYCVLDMQTGKDRIAGSFSYTAMVFAACSEYSTAPPPYTSRTMVSIFVLMGSFFASYSSLKSEGAWHAAMTALPKSTAPAPPLEKCSATTASLAPFSFAMRLMAASSASVSPAKRLMATTAWTPCFRTFSMWEMRFAQPFSTSATFSSVYSLLNAWPATTFGASQLCNFKARTEQTMTAQSGLSPL
mmetsp:Transcript_122306/g.341210  ORF Transcript_122306/g.341210 Transcript_122306/m.341210 type:complete len:208 (+) Transcript_122306:611-1234(+)